MDLIAATLPQPVKVGGANFSVAPPTVAIALTLMAVQPGQPLEDEDVYYLTLFEWLGEPLSQVLAGQGEKRPRIVDAILRSFTPKPLTEQPKDKKKKTAAIEEPDWEILILDYAITLGIDPWAVWRETPWPVFLVMVRRLEQAIAKGQIRQLDLVTLPHSGKHAKEVLGRIKERATTDPGQDAPKESRMMTDPAYREEQLRRLDLMFGRVHADAPEDATE